MSKKTNVLLIRKWLKVLLDRSLVLGSVDKPQLHDLVLDFVLGQHTEAELRVAHRAVVSAFRECRTVSIGGVVGWSLSNQGDETTRYVAHEVEHHIVAARDVDDGGAGFKDWVADTVLDYITQSAGKVLGAQVLGQVAEEAEREEEFLSAASVWQLQAWVRRTVEQINDEETFLSSFKAIDALKKVQVKRGQDIKSGLSQKAVERLSIQVVGQIAINGGAFMCKDEYEARKDFAEICEGMGEAPFMPFEMLVIRMSNRGAMDKLLEGNITGLARIFFDLFGQMLADLEAVEDPRTRDQGRTIIGSWDFILTNIQPLVPEFSWDTWPTDVVVSACENYDFSIMHTMLQDAFDDFVCVGPMGLGMIVHEGAISLASQTMQVHKDAWSQCLQEPDQTKERMSQMVSSGGFSAWFCIMFGLTPMLEEMYNEAEHTWGRAIYRAKEFAEQGKLSAFVRNRGVQEKGATFFLSEEILEIQMRTNHLLVTECREVPKSKILQWLPSVSDVVDCMDVHETAGGALVTYFGFPMFNLALLCEQLGESERCFEFLEKCIMPREPGAYVLPTEEAVMEFGRQCGDYKPTSNMLGLCIKGRMLAFEGRTAEAMEALEMADAQAEKLGFWLLALLALRDMHATVVMSGERDSERVRVERRMGKVLRRLSAHATTKELDHFLNSSFVVTYQKRGQDLDFDSEALLASR